MNKEEKTDVIFRCNKFGDFKDVVLALFPHEVSDYKGSVLSYEHIGQHSGADYSGCIKDSRPATKKEYIGLKRELESIGYNLNIVKRRNYDKYLVDLKRVRKHLK